MNVSAIIVTRGNVDVMPIPNSLPPEWEKVVWENGGGLCSVYEGSGDRMVLRMTNVVNDQSVYGRYAAIIPDRARLFTHIGERTTDAAVVAVNVPSRLCALSRPAALSQIIDDPVGADEVVALAASAGFEPLVVERYGVETPNQYVSCAFSRTYPVSGVIKRRLRRRARDAFERRVRPDRPAAYSLEGRYLRAVH